jgi:hypothetical protein
LVNLKHALLSELVGNKYLFMIYLYYWQPEIASQQMTVVYLQKEQFNINYINTDTSFGRGSQISK